MPILFCTRTEWLSFVAFITSFIAVNLVSGADKEAFARLIWSVSTALAPVASVHQERFSINHEMTRSFPKIGFEHSFNFCDLLHGENGKVLYPGPIHVPLTRAVKQKPSIGLLDLCSIFQGLYNGSIVNGILRIGSFVFMPVSFVSG